MQWFFRHPYVVSLLFAGLLFLVGILIVSKRSSVDPADSRTRAWAGLGSNFFETFPGAGNAPTPPAGKLSPKPAGESLYVEILKGPPFHYDQGSSSLPTESAPEDDFDFEAFLAMLSGSSGEKSEPVAEDDPSSLDAYSFIPKGLISVSTGGKERTPSAQKLYEYGNEIGSDIQTYEDAHRNAPQVLRDQFEDRGDAGKDAALLDLAEAMKGLGERLATMEEVPAEIAPAHARLAASYRDMGEKLSHIPDAADDQALVDTILSYNASVEAFTKNFVALAVLFSAHDVGFAESDPGAVFVFTNTAGL